jgi:hypothetical protein
VRSHAGNAIGSPKVSEAQIASRRGLGAPAQQLSIYMARISAESFEQHGDKRETAMSSRLRGRIWSLEISALSIGRHTFEARRATSLV